MNIVCLDGVGGDEYIHQKHGRCREIKAASGRRLVSTPFPLGLTLRRSNPSTCSYCDKWRLARRSLQTNWVTQDTLEHLCKVYLGFECGFFCSVRRVAFCSSVGHCRTQTLRAGDLPLGVECDWSIVRKLLGQRHLQWWLGCAKIFGFSRCARLFWLPTRSFDQYSS